MAFVKKHRWALLGALAGALVFVALYGVQVLNPTNVNWIMNNASPDPAQHYLGWAFFRNSPWRLPYVGANYNVVYPFRTSVLFTDSIPLLALLFKVLGPLLPTEFQYFGWWGLACYALQGALGQRLVARVAGVKQNDTPRQLAALAGALVVVLFPALNIRMFAHTALAANWLILLAFYLWLCGDALLPTTRRACLAWAGVGLLCAGIHLYYLPMVGVVLVAFCLRRFWQRKAAGQQKGRWCVFLPVPAFCAAALAEIVLLGAFAANFAGYANGFLDGADLLNLIVPDLGATWEQEIYAGTGTVLALALAGVGVVLYCLRNGPRGLAAFCKAHKGWLASGLVLLVLDAVAATGNTVVLGGVTLFTIPLPQPLLDFWSMFSSCARLAWVAGLLLAVVGCGAVLRLWGVRGGAALLVLCALGQAWGQREQLAARYETYHTPATYAEQTALTDAAWQAVAQSGQFSHLAFASFDFGQEHFWDLTRYAAQNDWTTNSFYLAHMDGNLAAVTLPGEMADLAPDTLYAFLQEDELTRSLYPLHYYRVNGILLGSVEPVEALDGYEDAAPAALTCASDLSLAALNGEADYTTANGVTLGEGGQMFTQDWLLQPGVYTVTLTGSGFDQSYIYSNYGLINQERTQLDITFTEVDAEKMVFQFTAGEVLPYWRVCVHSLNDAPVVVGEVLVEKIG